MFWWEVRMTKQTSVKEVAIEKSLERWGIVSDRPRWGRSCGQSHLSSSGAPKTTQVTNAAFPVTVHVAITELIHAHLIKRGMILNVPISGLQVIFLDMLMVFVTRRSSWSQSTATYRHDPSQTSGPSPALLRLMGPQFPGVFLHFCNIDSLLSSYLPRYFKSFVVCLLFSFFIKGLKCLFKTVLRFFKN